MITLHGARQAREEFESGRKALGIHTYDPLFDGVEQFAQGGRDEGILLSQNMELVVKWIVTTSLPPL